MRSAPEVEGSKPSPGTTIIKKLTSKNLKFINSIVEFKTRMDTLILTGEEVERLLNMKKVVDDVELAFREKGMNRVQMPPKIYLYFKKYNGDLRAMPAYLESLDIAGVKIVNSHPLNKREGLLTVMAVIELVDPQNGLPIAVMDGTLITAFRTGASSAVATKYLAREDSRVLGIIGAGAQALPQIEAISIVRDIEEIRIFDIDRYASDRLASKLKEKSFDNVKIDDNPRKLAENSDIITTLTPSKEPIIFDDWIMEGTHINAIGADAPGKQELDPNILRRSKIVVDDLEQTVHSGEVNVPLSKGLISKDEIYAELGEIVAGKKLGRESDEEITVFDSTGLAILDVITAYFVYKKALEHKYGKKIDLIKV